MIERPPFPKVVDSTILAAFRSCPRKFELEFLNSWRPAEPSVHLHAGGAYAHGLEAARRAFFEHGESPSVAKAIGIKALLEFYGSFECPEDSAKSATRMAGALEFYLDRYPLETDQALPIFLPGGQRGIEFSFNEPLSVVHPETGDPLIYAGRMDMIVDYQNLILGEDDKTTSSLGASWASQWDLRSQFTGYTWGALQHGIKMDGFLIRGVSILKNRYDTQQALTYRPQWQIDRWLHQVESDLERMKSMWSSGAFDYNLDHACAEFGGCVFRRVCLMQDPTPLLQQQFQRRAWDPVSRVETIL